MKASQTVFVLLLCAVVNGCGARIIKADGDVPPVYRLGDGSLCKAPAGYPGIVAAPGTRQVRALFLSSTSAYDTAAAVVDLPTHDELDAALYLSCGEFARKELSRDVFAHQRRIYQALRLQHLTRGIQRWRDDPNGFESSGKLCHFIFSGDTVDPRNVTRLVPQQTTADDCALHVSTNGGTHVILGCSAGRWKTHWAPKRLLVGPNGWANRRRSLVDTQYVPTPDCEWG